MRKDPINFEEEVQKIRNGESGLAEVKAYIPTEALPLLKAFSASHSEIPVGDVEATIQYMVDAWVHGFNSAYHLNGATPTMEDGSEWKP